MYPFFRARDFLAHRFSENIGFAQRVSAESLGNQHDLILVHDHPVGRFEELSQVVVGVGDLCPTVFGIDERADVFHRPGSVQCDHGCKVVDRGRFQFFDVAPHTGRFKLEYTGGIAFAKKPERLFVVDRNIVNPGVFAGCFGDQLHTAVENRQVGKAQKIHLE